jgi:carbonic anhydrase
MIDGEDMMPLEDHFVHQNNKTYYAIIGVMYKEGKENPLLKSNLDKFPIEKEVYNSYKPIDLLEILPDNKIYYHYNGSLTTPPCNEVVNFYLLKDPIEASKKQLDRMSQILNNNHRPVQNLNGRRISFYLHQPKLLTKTKTINRLFPLVVY